ncbi:MAG: AmmeMemoRadiSam system protein B [Saprospiraceae bacterium]|nr:AmmeMemoRadiSam system protein B [Saprospiraceae bacterium]
MKIRKPYFSGRFYPASKTELVNLIDRILDIEKKKIDLSFSEKKLIGAVVPHAAYMFSGYQAVHFFEILKRNKEKFDTVFILNPSHTGLGKKISLDANTHWETPLGISEVDNDFMQYLNFHISEEGHAYEHSGEVILPLIQHFLKYDFKILPITIRWQDYKHAKLIAEEIFRVNAKLKKKILLIASSDFSHHVQPDIGKKLDYLVVNEITSFDAEKVGEIVSKKNISVCGYGSIMSLIEYSKLVSENPVSKVLKYGNSGEVMPSDSVVDYASILMYSD